MLQPPNRGAGFVEEGVRFSRPGRIEDGVAPSASLREPEVPLPIDVRMVQVEDGIQRRRRHAAHRAAHLSVHAAVGTLDRAAGRVEIGQAERRPDVDREGIQ